jgi:hypothetical protein
MQGILLDGTIIAVKTLSFFLISKVKTLSSKSNQGNCEFVDEIGMISALQHPDLVRLYGFVLKEINYSWCTNTWKTIAWHTLCSVSFIFHFCILHGLKHRNLTLQMIYIRN